MRGVMNTIKHTVKDGLFTSDYSDLSIIKRILVCYNIIVFKKVIFQGEHQQLEQEQSKEGR
jgi:hypothetical protein